MATSHPPTFSQWVRRLRTQRDLTQEALAELAFCSVQTIRSFETGKRRPSMEMAERLAEVLGVPAEQQATFVHLARMALPAEAEDNPSSPPALLAPGGRSPLTAAFGLPNVTTPFIGRAAEIQAINRLIRQEQQRLVTLVGPGGIGKTRLALDLTASLANHFPDGAGFVSLAAINQGQHLASTLAASLNIGLQGVTDPLQQVNAWLAPRRMLLTLDNFEHLLTQPDVVAWVRQLAATAPHLHLLITSRERLRVSGERVFDLTGLPLPAPDRPLEEADAALLFLERAQQVESAFTLNGQNQAAVSRICHLVEGMPLGIELAAAWVHVLTVGEIADEISRSIDFLARADRDMTPRHRSMRAVFDHSWHLLSEEERSVLMKLSLFRGGCTREAAQQVAGATLPVLASLIDKSLLRRSSTTPTRYAMHELVRQYAADRLQADPASAAATVARHGAYYCTFVSARMASMQDQRQRESVAEIDADIDNIRLAWQWAVTEEQVGHLMAMALPFWFYLDNKDFYQEGEASFRQARLMAQTRLRTLASTLSAAEQVASERLAAHMSTHEAYFVLRHVRLAEAQALLVPAIATLQQYNDALPLLMARWHLGNTQWFHGEFAAAAANFSETLARSRQVGDLHRSALLAMFLGGIHHEQGEYLTAYALLDTAAKEAQQVGTPRLIAYGAWCLSRTARQIARSDAVLPLLEQGLHLSRTTGDWFCSGLCLEELAWITFSAGDHATAQRLMAESIDLQQRIGDKWSQSRALVHLGTMLHQTGQLAPARRHLLAALRLAHSADLLPHLLDALHGLAHLLAEEGDPQQAYTLANAVATHSASSHATRQGASQLCTTLTVQLSLGEQAKQPPPSLTALVTELLRG